MQEIRSIISRLERKKVDYEYRLDYMNETISSLDDDEASAYQSETEKVERKISTLEFEIQLAQNVLSELEFLKRKIDTLENEWDNAASYKNGANSERAKKIRAEINNQESLFAEKYNETLYRLQNL